MVEVDNQILFVPLKVSGHSYGILVGSLSWAMQRCGFASRIYWQIVIGNE